VPPERPLFDEIGLAVASFLARYCDPTRTSSTHDRKSFFAWCERHHLDVLTLKRGHVELWARTMDDAGLARATIGRRLSTVAGFYRFAAIDGVLEHSPAEYVRRPKIDTESTTLGLDRMELGAFIAQGAAAGPTDHALACLLGSLGLRVGEACSINIEALSTERGHRTVTVLGKGSIDPVWEPHQPPGGHPDRPAAREAGRGSPSASRLTARVTASSRPRPTPACPSATSRLQPATPTRAPPPVTIGPPTTSIGTPATSSPPSSLAPPERYRMDCEPPPAARRLIASQYGTLASGCQPSGVQLPIPGYRRVWSNRARLWM
jgi:hypothetical protein